MDGNKGKRVLITGCSSGFGFYTVVAAAKAGFDCIATMRNLTTADVLEEALEKENVSATIDILDVTDPKNIEEIAEKYAPIDILINNAAQTVRRPPEFYSHLMENESMARSKLSANAQKLMLNYQSCLNKLQSCTAYT